MPRSLLLPFARYRVVPIVGQRHVNRTVAAEDAARILRRPVRLEGRVLDGGSAQRLTVGCVVHPLISRLKQTALSCQQIL